MKNVCLSTFVILILFVQGMNAQILDRTGSFVANDPGVYPISGDVRVEYNAGSVTVFFENNFATVQGLALEVFLSRSKNLNTGTDTKISLMPLDQGTPTNTPIIGMRTFNVPTGVSLYEYDNVLIQCTTINELWGHANLCETNLNLSVSNLPSDTYHAQQNLTSSSSVAPSSDITFEASDCVQLVSGFYAPASTDFYANAASGLGCIIQ